MLCTFTVHSQVININQTFSSDTIFTPFIGSSGVYLLKAYGNVNLYSDSSLVRIVMVDSYGNHWLVYESYPLITDTNSFVFNAGCDETCFLDGIVPDSIRIDIISAFLTLDSLKLDTNYIPNATELQAQAKWNNDSIKIAIMNMRIIEEKMYWRAGRSPFTQFSFNEREKHFGIKHSLEGFDYYIGGIFEYMNHRAVGQESTDHVSHFDWRSRHGANIPGSPYYHEDPDGLGSGWLTPIEDQGGLNSCWVFSSSHTFADRINLYCARHLHYDFSEEELYRCALSYCSGNSCEGGGYNNCALAIIRDHGVHIEEQCSTYYNDTVNCPDVCWGTDKFYLQYFENISYSGPPYSIELLQESLILNGPLASGIEPPYTPNPYSTIGHDMELSGYHTVQYLDTVYYPSGPNEPLIVIDSGCPLLGKLYWIFKNSYGPNNPNYTPYYLVACPINYISKTNKLSGYISSSNPNIDLQPSCLDLDGDGYYFWGISQTTPCSTCPAGIDPREDCDDSNPFSGPYQQDYACRSNCAYDPEPIQLTNQTTIVQDFHLNQDLVIPDDYLVIIQGTLCMAPQAKIIVQPGGKLSINGGTITSMCDDLWQGIIVQGHTFSPQDTAYQGIVSINNGTIENAVIGISAGQDGASVAGGIIIANNAIFKNNEVSVKFYSYGHGSISIFSNTTFKTTTTHLLDGRDFTEFVLLYEINGITFDKCSFMYEPGDEFKGTGIKAYNSGFNFDGKKNTNITNFRNLLYGIYSYSNGFQYPDIIQITGSKFENNLRGVYFGSIENGVVTENQFYIPPPCSIPENGGPVLSQCASRYGLYMNNSTGYKVEENLFTSYPESSFYQGDIGLNIRNSGAVANEIYKNSFTNLVFGATAIGENRNIADTIGLCFQCNEFDNCRYDIYVTQGQQEYNPNIGVDYYHGSPSLPAGNIFSLPPLMAMRFDDEIEQSPVEYFWYEPDDLQNPDPSNNVIPHSIVPENACLSHLFDGGEDSLRIEREILKNNIDSLAGDLSIIIDGGDTPGLNAEIVTSIPGQTLQVYDELILQSPNLSDTVLNSAVEKEDVLNNALLRDIMVANPQSAKRDSLIQKLDQRIVPMPDTMKAEILEGINYMSQRELLESEIGMKRNLERKLFYALSRCIIQDAITPAPLDSLKNLLEADNNPESKYSLAFILLHQDSIISANSVLSGIPSSFNLSPKEQSVHQAYLVYFQALELLYQVGQFIPVTDSILIEDFQSLAENDIDIPGAYARNLLMASGLMNYSEPIEFPDTSVAGPAVPIWNNGKDQWQETNPLESYIKIFPNPANDYFIIEFYCSSIKDGQDVQIIITDGHGSLIRDLYPSKLYDQVLFRTGNLPPGIYLCELKINKKVFTSNKFILSR